MSSQLINLIKQHHGGVAQLGEHLPCKQGVKGSNPSISIWYVSTGKREGKQVLDEPHRQERIAMYLENRIYENILY